MKFSGMMKRTLHSVIGETKPWVTGVYNILFPNVCAVCHQSLIKGEKHLCLKCLVDLPVTNLHRVTPNLIHDRLFSLGLRIERATSYFYYSRESKYKSIIIDTKYHGRPSLGKAMAARHAGELKSYNFFDGIDYIIPVPLHHIKRMIRGYNQAQKIAEGISDMAGIPVLDALKAAYHSTQTRKDPHERLKNVDQVYSVKEGMKAVIENRHILLLDDVITTGATILSCMNALKRASPTTKVSVYSLALTKFL